jgi:hypothetical protein
MRTVLQRIRGAIGTGLVWAFAWSAVGITPRWILGYKPDAPFPIIFGVFGFLAGVIFAALLALTAGNRRFDEMSLRRFAGWGAVGGAILSVFLVKALSLGVGDALLVAPTIAIACGISAAGSLAIARRAERGALTAGVADASVLSDAEQRKLLERD